MIKLYSVAVSRTLLLNCYAKSWIRVSNHTIYDIYYWLKTRQTRKGEWYREASLAPLIHVDRTKNELNDTARKALQGLQKDPSFAVSLWRLQQAGLAVAFEVVTELQIRMMAVENYTLQLPYQLVVEAEAVHSRINQAGFEDRFRNLTHQRTVIPN